jgi:hypothetical protein
VTNASSIQEIITIIGEPRQISYDKEGSLTDGEPSIELQYKGEAYAGQLVIYVSVKENKIVKVKFF